MAENLRDDRSGQKLNFQFYNFFCIWPPGGAMSLFTFSVFGHFDQLRIFFFHFFWLQQVPWVKPQHISKIQTGVFWFSHFMRQNVNKLLRIRFFGILWRLKVKWKCNKHLGVLFLYLKMTFYPKLIRCFGWLFVLKRVVMRSKFYTVYCVHKILRHFTSANLFQLNHMHDQWYKVLVNGQIQLKIKVIIKPWLILEVLAFIF